MSRERGREERGVQRGNKKKKKNGRVGWKQQVGKMPQFFMTQRCICNTFITLLPCKPAAASHQGCRLQGRESRERERGWNTEGTDNSLLPWKVQSPEPDSSTVCSSILMCIILKVIRKQPGSNVGELKTHGNCWQLYYRRWILWLKCWVFSLNDTWLTWTWQNKFNRLKRTDWNFMQTGKVLKSFTNKTK